MPRKKPDPCGVEFPVTNASTGKRSTQQAGRDIFAAALGAVSKEHGEKCQNLPSHKWRSVYKKYIIDSVKLGTGSPRNAVNIAEAGLGAAHNKFEFIRDGKTYSLADAMETFGKSHNFKTGTVKGTGKKGTYKIPYKGTDLRGKELDAQIDRWVSYGTIEASAGNAIKGIAKSTPDLSNTYFVLLGAGSAMGPFNVLMDLGANVVAIDLGPVTKYSFMKRGWDRLMDTAKKSSGSLIFPITPTQGENDEARIAGADLLQQTPEIAAWLSGLPYENLVIGAYAYLDGDRFVKLSIAMDAIIDSVAKTRRKMPAIAYLCTPTDVHVVPNECHSAMKKNYNNAPCWQKVIRCIPPILRPNAGKEVGSEDGETYYLCDALVDRQGCNYALAKRLQHWRAMKHRNDGGVVSTNVAPASTTISVISNWLFKASYGGMHNFKPLEVFHQDVSNHVMTALLLHDINTNDGAANPGTKLRNPLALFSEGAFHGGMWRCGYTLDSIGEVSALSFWLDEFKLYIFLILLLIGYATYALLF